MSDLYIRTHRPGDIGYIIHRHGVLYSELCGWGTQFEGWVAQIMSSFIAHYDPELERCWIAEKGGRFQGSVMVCKADAPDTAKIRVLLVEPEARGLGLGKRLSQMCIDFAREKGFQKVTLVTQSNLTAARAIYSRMGFVCTGSAPSKHFESVDSEEETWELQLQIIKDELVGQVGNVQVINVNLVKGGAALAGPHAGIAGHKRSVEDGELRAVHVVDVNLDAAACGVDAQPVPVVCDDCEGCPGQLFSVAVISAAQDHETPGDQAGEIAVVRIRAASNVRGAEDEARAAAAVQEGHIRADDEVMECSIQERLGMRVGGNKGLAPRVETPVCDLPALLRAIAEAKVADDANASPRLAPEPTTVGRSVAVPRRNDVDCHAVGCRHVGAGLSGLDSVSSASGQAKVAFGGHTDC
ncbi:hypothetical protein PWT90_09423 [Aphanocladium album]|nr:hypothetical protein PWT90_09423 [Aphanocladium album]